MEMTKEKRRLPMYGHTVFINGEEITSPLAEGHFSYSIGNIGAVFIADAVQGKKKCADISEWPPFILSQEDIAWAGRLDCFEDPEAARRYFGV